jgi:hypothetical protein
LSLYEKLFDLKIWEIILKINGLVIHTTQVKRGKSRNNVRRRIYEVNNADTEIRTLSCPLKEKDGKRQE